MNILKYALLLALGFLAACATVQAEEVGSVTATVTDSGVAVKLNAGPSAADTVRSPEEQAVIDAEAKAVATRKALEEKKAIEAARKKAEWNSKTFTEAMAIRGQATVDAAQYVGGKTVQGLATADGYIGAGVAYPVNLIAASAFGLAEGSKAYAAKAWDNEPTQVAVKADAPETK